MKKGELKKLRTLKATKKMMQMAVDDIVKRERAGTWSGAGYREKYQYGLYMRCQTLEGILKVAFFLPDQMRMGGNLPAYELFINNQTGEFLTYDRKLDRWLTAKVDMLEWPRYVCYSEKKWINQEGYKTIKNYLGVSCGGYKGILEYQLNIRKEELKQRHKRETDPWDLDMEQTPELPRDWNQWVAKVGIPENYIFYRYDRKGAKEGVCTYCEKEVPIICPKHNKQGTCPCCRHKVIFKAEGRAAGVVSTDIEEMYLIQRCEDGVMVREFTGSRSYKKSEGYRITECRFSEVRRCIFDKEGHARKAYYWGDYKHAEQRWIQTRFCSVEANSYYYFYHTYEGRVYGRTLPDLAKKELQKTGLAEAVTVVKEIDPEKYLLVWAKVPELEQLAKAGLARLVEECIHKNDKVVNCFHHRLFGGLKRILGIDSQELARLRKANGGISFLKWLQYEKATGKPLPDHVIRWFCQEEISQEDLKFISDRMSMVQIYNYVRRQMKESKMKSREVLTTWSDYLSMAERFHMDTRDAIVYRVRKLRRRHDEMVERCNGKVSIVLKAGEILREYPHVEQIYDSIRDIYEYGDEEYSVVCPRCIEDVLVEGDNLHHCVGSSDRYWERIERRESYVLFLRRSGDKEKAYYTLEIEPDGTVRQQRTMYDRQEKDIEEAKKFLRKWQKEVSKRIGGEEKKLAEVSHVLREQEFAEMREKQLIINTGELSGRLLVDVLTEDLMEAA